MVGGPRQRFFKKKRIILCRGPPETALGKDSVPGTGAVTAAFLCRVPLQPSAKALPRAALGKELSGNFESAKRVFAEGPLSGTRQSLCRGLERHSAKKSSRLRGPSAKKCAEFFQKIFAEVNGTALGKELFFFLKNLC